MDNPQQGDSVDYLSWLTDQLQSTEDQDIGVRLAEELFKNYKTTETTAATEAIVTTPVVETETASESVTESETVKKAKKRKTPANSEPSAKLKAHLKHLEEEKKAKKGEEKKKDPKESSITLIRIVKRY